MPRSTSTCRTTLVLSSRLRRSLLLFLRSKPRESVTPFVRTQDVSAASTAVDFRCPCRRCFSSPGLADHERQVRTEAWVTMFSTISVAGGESRIIPKRDWHRLADVSAKIKVRDDLAHRTSSVRRDSCDTSVHDARIGLRVSVGSHTAPSTSRTPAKPNAQS